MYLSEYIVSVCIYISELEFKVRLDIRTCKLTRGQVTYFAASREL